MMEYLPPALQDLKKTIDQHCRQIFQNMLSHLELVTRQEFDAQTAVLARTREKLEKIESDLTTKGYLNSIENPSGYIIKPENHIDYPSTPDK